MLALLKMRTLTFDNQEGTFYLDQVDIGDYIEISGVKRLPQRKVASQACYNFQLCLEFSCNASACEYVDFWTFIKRVRYQMLKMADLPNQTFVLRTQRPIGKDLFVFKMRELVT